MQIEVQRRDTNHIDKMSSELDNRGILPGQTLIMEMRHNPSRTESLNARAEKAIEKLQGHVKLSQSPELSVLLGQIQPGQTLVATQTLVDVMDILRDSIINFSTLELDAAQDSFAAEESHLLNDLIRERTRQLYTLIEIIREKIPTTIAEVEGIERDLRASHSKIG
ncbi:hypothetical protein ACOK4R_35490 (plasmid) [Pseudomonas fluorescens]|uniref:hypothetical protein n=1 Tax=Pseudomonas TaxID=286 RepID=UPI001F129F24|nr:hypothetical protein [Pseudomonas viridiflava]